MVGSGEHLIDECEALCLATRFSFLNWRRADEVDPRERAEPGEDLYFEARWIVPTDRSEALDCWSLGTLGHAFPAMEGEIAVGLWSRNPDIVAEKAYRNPIPRLFYRERRDAP